MQTCVPAPAEQVKQQQAKTAQKPAQLVGSEPVIFEDNRLEAAAQLRLQKFAGSNPKTTQLKTMQSIINGSSLVEQKQGQVIPAFQMKKNLQGNLGSCSNGQLWSETALVQLRSTKIIHEYGTYDGSLAAADSAIAKERVGLHMHAELMPEDPVVGSEPPKENSSMYAALWKSNGIVRGHLLNHDLGGHGAPENLFPITSGANSRHSKEVEGPVKDQLYMAKVETEKGNDQSVIYDVNVINNSNAGSGFACQWARKDANGKIIDGDSANIDSSFVPGTKGDHWSGTGAGKKTSGWAHKKGSKFDADDFKKDQDSKRIESREAKHVGGKVGAVSKSDSQLRINLKEAQDIFHSSILDGERMQRHISRMSADEGSDLLAQIENELEQINDDLYGMYYEDSVVPSKEKFVVAFKMRFHLSS